MASTPKGAPGFIESGLFETEFPEPTIERAFAQAQSGGKVLAGTGKAWDDALERVRRGGCLLGSVRRDGWLQGRRVIWVEQQVFGGDDA